MIIQTIVLAVCLIGQPLTCKDVNLLVSPEFGASLQLPFWCAKQGQIEAQNWSTSNPNWHIEKWSCPPNDKKGVKI